MRDAVDCAEGGAAGSRGSDKEEGAGYFGGDEGQSGKLNNAVERIIRTERHVNADKRSKLHPKAESYSKTHLQPRKVVHQWECDNSG